MNCERPYIMKGGAYGCGQCLPCRIGRRRVWTHRILLEAAQHESNCFVTLTYDDANLPLDHSVSPRELQLFIKRLRKNYPAKIRYFACGEYGEQSGRPHYHLAIFGYPSCDRGITNHRRPNCCPHCDQIRDAWGKGTILNGQLEQQSAAYVAGYVSKKYTAVQSFAERHPPFARMSLRPALGLFMMHELASTLMQHGLDEKMVDVPLALQHGTKQWPLGRYLRRKLRTFIGRDINAPQSVLDAQSEELQTLRESAWNTKTSVKAAVLEKSLGRRIQINARQRRTKRETI